MIPQYLSELLLRFDNVVLPGFGDFRLMSIPASIKGDVILPPGKILKFDPTTIVNDGVLANYISEKDRISFFDACTKILEFVERIQKDLSNGQEVSLEKLGSFIKEPSGAILFTADKNADYSIDTFGLTPINVAPIKSNQSTKKPENKKGVEKLPKKKKFPVAAIWIIAVIVFFGGGTAGVYFLKPDLLQEIGNIMGIHKENKLTLTEDNTQKDIDVTADTISKSGIVENDLLTQQVKVKYYIIAASFRIKENADNYVVTLNNQGNNSESIFLEERNLYAVSYNVYNDKVQAEQILEEFRKSGNRDAWILEK